MKQLLVIMLLLCSMSVSAQDVIVKKDGSTIVCQVVEVTAKEITYKKWDDLNGSNYVMDKSLASAINYADGKKETIGESENQYKPGNQNDGTRQYNDRALLVLDDAIQKYDPQRAKTLRTIGWIGGGVLIAATIVSCVMPDVRDWSEDFYYIGAACGVGAVAWTTSFLLAANHQKKKAQMLQSSTIYQHDFKFDNGSSLSLGADMIHDRLLSNHTIGLGLLYNF